MLIIPLRDTVT